MIVFSGPDVEVATVSAQRAFFLDWLKPVSRESVE